MQMKELYGQRAREVIMPLERRRRSAPALPKIRKKEVGQQRKVAHPAQRANAKIQSLMMMMTMKMIAR